MLTVADWLRVDSGGPWLFDKVSFCLSVGEEQNKEERDQILCSVFT